MPLHLMLTVGTNPLPVLVAAHRLLKLHPGAPLTLLTSAETENEAKLVLEALRTRYGETSVPPSWGIEKTLSATSPQAIREKVNELLSYKKLAAQNVVHLNYTGGTKTMGIETLKALLEAHVAVSDSYLDSQSRRLVDNQGMDLSCKDERDEWNLGIRDLAALHGFQTDFSYERNAVIYEFGALLENGDRARKNPPQNPAQAWVDIARIIYDLWVAGEPVVRMLSTFNQAVAWPDWPRPERFLDRLVFPRLTKALPEKKANWNSLPVRINAAARSEWAIRNEILQPATGHWVLDPMQLSGPQLFFVCKLLESQWLEVVAMDALKRALQKHPISICCGTQFCRPQEGATMARTFELDVTAVLGYQLFVVSCTTEDTPSSVRNKAFEAILRARQVGGDDARVIVASGIKDPGPVERDVHRNIGSKGDDPPVVIWGRQQLANIDREMEAYVSAKLLGE